MGIDQIGKKGPTLPPPKDEVGGHRSIETGRPFEVSASPIAPSSHEAEAIASSHPALDRFRAGEVDMKGYLDLKVNEATAHLAGMPAPELDAIRDALRHRMASDPMLVDLIRIATGRAPELPGDG